MIKIKTLEVAGFAAAVQALRLPFAEQLILVGLEKN